MAAMTVPTRARGSLLLAMAMAAASAEETGRTFIYMSGNAPEITCWRHDPGTATMEKLSTSPGGTAPSYLAWSPDRRTMYAVDSAPGGDLVRAWRIAAQDGALDPLSKQLSGGKGTCHVSVHPSGRWVYAASYTSGHVAVLPVMPDGGLGAALQVERAGEKAHMAITDPAGKFLFVPCLGSDWIAVYGIDPATGALAEPVTAALPPKAGPRHLAFHPHGRFAYVLNELASSLTRFAFAAETGTLSDPRTVTALPAGFTGKNSGAHLVITPDGRFLYASLRGHDSLAVFGLDAASGEATLLGHETGGGEIRTPRNFTLDAGGRFAFVASQGADLLTIFRVDAASGQLTRTGSIPTTRKPTFVGVMPAP